MIIPAQSPLSEYSSVNKPPVTVVERLYQSRYQIAKYLLVGCSTVVLDLTTLVFLKEYVRLSAVWAVVVNQVFVFLYNFSLNKYWSFLNFALPYRQFVRYLTLAAFNYGISILSMIIIHTWLHYDYRLVRLGSIMLVASWNFFFYKYWVYGNRI